MFKNVASQKIQLFAFDATTNVPKTGDAAQLTAYVSKDHGAVTVLADTSATEMDATNSPGVYVFDLATGETNADELTFSAKSSTANVKIVPRFISTNPPKFTSPWVLASGGAVVCDPSGLPFPTNFASMAITAGGAVTAGTGDAYARLGAPAGASHAADVAAVKVDTAAVKVQTDKLTFTVANKLDGNIKAVNDVTVAGVGTAGNPWGP